MGNSNTINRATFAPSTGQVNTNTTVILKDVNSATVKVSIKKSVLSKRSAIIRASGVFTAVSGNQTILIKAVADDGVQTAPVSGGTTIATSGALGAANAGPFCLEFHCYGDPASDKLHGYVAGTVGDVVVVYAVNLNTSFDPDLAWVFGVALTSGTSATVILQNLEVDLL